MIALPQATAVGRRLPKEAFYKHLSLAKPVKAAFVSDVERIVVENSLTRASLKLSADSEIEEILVLSILLRKRDFDERIIEAVARQNPHRLVFLLACEDMRQLALYHGKLYRSSWAPETELALTANGFSLAEIWNGFIEQIALHGERTESAAHMTIDERLAQQEKMVKLEKQIAKTEAAAWKETQPKKRFELYSRVHKYKQELEALTHNAE